MMIKVLLVDDHDLVRKGIKRLLDDIKDIDVVAEAGTGEQAVRIAKEHKPDVILMDVSMPGIGGLEATRKIKKSCPDIKIIAVTIHDNDPFPVRLLEAGALGYLTKGCDIDNIANAIRSVHKGNRFLSPEIAQALALTFLPGGDKSPFDQLSQREMQVMMMVTEGQCIRDISDQLCLSPKTISTYRYRLYEKLQVVNDVELTHLAIRYGIIDESRLQ